MTDVAVTRESLDGLGCGHPDHAGDACGAPLYLHSRCHPDSPTWSVYHEGRLTVECAACGSPVVVVEVART